ncbi:ABC transporter substrate-binding protein [Marinicrinis lubricantis]|uniref:ABC transporter substrate-binding protein n=1 Tax=Marinicrinis lubricantis TaxID=2086470 RepID=A0ABW1IQZ0_9BACL
MQTSRKKLAWLVCLIMIISIAAACSNNTNNQGENKGTNTSADTSEKKVTISLLTDNTQEQVNSAKAVIEAFQSKYPNITVEHETRPAGAEGDNFVKTRFATGDMNDVFFYNSGSLMHALNPETNFLELTDETFMENVIDSYKPTVTFNGKLYGVPAGSTMGGGWFYNKKVYEQLGLTVPKSWEELMQNNEKIKEAGIVPVIGTYKDSWTSQLIVLADYFNLQAQEPNFAEDYTAGEAKYATTPAAFRSFEKLQEVYDRGFLNEDFLATTYDAGIRMLAEGKGAHYPMLTFAIPVLEQNFPEQLDDIGFFAQPGDNADQNGLTVWMPAAAYISKNTEHPEEAKLFLEFLTTQEGLTAWSSAAKPVGPWAIEGAEIGDDVAQVVKDMLPYFESGATTPALEFVSPIKGPNLPQFTTEVGAGISNAEDGAKGYDKDVEKQAQQLGLEGW